MLDRKPVIMSTGTSSLDEIDSTIAFMSQHGFEFENLILMKCTSNYPANLSSANVLQMNLLSDRYQCRVGYSDHTVGPAACIAAAALGAVCVEKHFTLVQGDNDIDGAFSAGVVQMKELVSTIHEINQVANYSLNQDDWSFSTSQFKRSFMLRSVLKRRSPLSRKPCSCSPIERRKCLLIV